MPSASATVSCARIARHARPVRLRRRLTQISSVSAGGGEQHEIPGARIGDREAADLGGSMTMPVEKPRLVSYSPPR